MSGKPLKLDSGIYPKPFATDIKLGDYGFWSNNQWNRKGNIIEDFRLFFRIGAEDLDESIMTLKGVNTEGMVTGENGTAVSSLNGSISFKSKNSFVFTAHLVSHKFFTAIQGEIFPALELLYKRGKWDMNDWLATSVYYSDNYCIMNSQNGGVGVKLSGDLAVEGLDIGKGGFSAVFGRENQAINQDCYCGNEGKFVGARFVSLTNKGIFSKGQKLKYNEEASVYELSDIDIAY